MMDPYRNREEQEKSAEECTPLPEPTDPAWAIPEDLPEDNDSAGEESSAVEEIAVEDYIKPLEQEQESVGSEGGEE